MLTPPLAAVFWPDLRYFLADQMWAIGMLEVPT